MPRKIRQLIAELKKAGFLQQDGGKNSHRKFKHPACAEAIIIPGNEGDDAKMYLEKQVKIIIQKTK